MPDKKIVTTITGISLLVNSLCYLILKLCKTSSVDANKEQVMHVHSDVDNGNDMNHLPQWIV